MQKLLLALVILATCRLQQTLGFATGAAGFVCNTDDMKPLHGVVGFNDRSSSFRITASETSYTAGGADSE